MLALILMSINSKDDIVEKYHRNEYKVNSNMNSMTISEHLKKCELLDFHCKHVAISNMLRTSVDIKYNSENSY